LGRQAADLLTHPLVFILSVAVWKTVNGEHFESRIGLKSGDAEDAGGLAGDDHPAGGVNGQSVQTIVAAIAEIHWKNW